MKPKLFVGSSTEALDIAYAVQDNLSHNAEVTVWTQGVFKPSQTSLDSIIQALKDMDFGAFIFAPDDIVSIRGEGGTVARDNVGFELAMFIATLGRDRSFILVPRNRGDLHLPTDLIGMEPIDYESDRIADNAVAATGTASNAIRRQIKDLGSRSRGGEASGVTQQEEKGVETRSLEGEEPTTPDRAEATLEEEALEAQARTSNELLEDMISAFVSADIERGEEVYEQAQNAESDANEKLRIEAIYLRLRYGRGDTTALDKLQDLAERAKEAPEVLPTVYEFVGSAYDIAEEFQAANKAYESAAEVAQSEEERAQYVNSAAHCLFEAGDTKEAFERLVVEIERTSSRKALSKLYSGLASLHKEAGNTDVRAIALQKALEYKPNDTQLRFGAAYSSSESDLSALSLMHYRILLRLKPDNAAALNNIGVIHEQLDMPIRQVNSYKKASEKGNTLAAANLAYQYLNAGFADEAKGVLNAARVEEDVHPNVGSALAAVSQKEEAESKIEAETLNAAHGQRRFLLAFAETYFTRPSVDPQFEGGWHFPDGVEVEITQSSDRLEMKWKRNDKEHVMSARAHNRGALIIEYSRRDTYLPSSLGDKGYAYLSEDNQHMQLMVLKDGKHSLLKLERNQ